MGRRIFKDWTGVFRKHAPNAWLVVHEHGDYEYRNPDSVYVHRFEHFPTQEAALDFLDRRVAKAERHEWTLYQAVSA